MTKVEITIKFTKRRACVGRDTTAAPDVSVYGGGYEAGQPHAGWPKFDLACNVEVR